MMSLKVKKLDRMLRSAFQEQGEKIVPPSSQKLWAELQQRPEFAKLEEEIEGKLAGMQKKRKSEGRGYAAFWKRHRYVTGLAAACFILVIIFAKLTPFAGRAGGFVNGLLALTQGMKARTEISMQSEDAAESSQPPPGENDTKLALKNFPLRAPLRATDKEAFSAPSASPALPEGEQARDEQARENEFQAALSLEEEEDGLRQESYDAATDRAAGDQEAQELIFEEETSFSLALEEVNHLATEGIWQIKYLPGEFQFRKGAIVRTERALLSVQQEYADREGHTFSLLQQFLQEEIVPGRIITTADSLDQPIQVGPYNGYLRRDQLGVHTLTWLQDKSIVTLSGELEEEQLYKILASMEDTSMMEDSSGMEENNSGR